MPKILLVEDDISITKTLSEYLQSEGFDVICAKGQSHAESLIESEQPQLLLLDISLEEGNGYGVCTAAKKLALPVIFLTASGDENSVVKGLDIGADDYIAKPFRPRELISRIRSVLRRYSGSDAIIKLGNICVDADKAAVTKNGVPIALSALEYRLFSALINNRGKLMSRNKLLEEIWDIAGDFVNDNTLTVYIKRLREKIEDDPQNPAVIKTVRGLGYRVD